VHERERSLADEYLAGRRRLLELRRDVDGVPGRQLLRASGVAVPLERRLIASK
jgi:hypothetical protein